MDPSKETITSGQTEEQRRLDSSVSKEIHLVHSDAAVEERYEGMSGADKKSMNKLEERALEEAEAQMKGSGSTSGVTAAAGGSEAESDQGSPRFCYCSIM